VSLSSSTIFLFAFLIPGILFRYTVYIDSIVKRPWGTGNALYITVNVLTVSLFLQIVAFFIFWFFSWLFSNIFSYSYDLGLVVFADKTYIFYNHHRFSITSFLINHFGISLAYFFILTIVTIVMAKALFYFARRYEYAGRFIFGQLASILKDTTSPIVPCFVLTKMCNGKDRLVYMGFIAEVALKDGSKIDHIVLSAPEKFYFRMNQRMPVTTYKNARSVSSFPYSPSLMYISGEEIENVHFDQYYI